MVFQIKRNKCIFKNFTYKCYRQRYDFKSTSHLITLSQTSKILLYTQVHNHRHVRNKIHIPTQQSRIFTYQFEYLSILAVLFGKLSYLISHVLSSGACSHVIHTQSCSHPFFISNWVII